MTCMYNIFSFLDQFKPMPYTFFKSLSLSVAYIYRVTLSCKPADPVVTRAPRFLFVSFINVKAFLMQMSTTDGSHMCNLLSKTILWLQRKAPFGCFKNNQNSSLSNIILNRFFILIVLLQRSGAQLSNMGQRFPLNFGNY